MWMSAGSMIAAAIVVVTAQAPPAARTNQCAACHLRLVWTTSGLTHVDEWVTSKHAWAGVGCEKCHGGDATAREQSKAHQGMAASADPNGPARAASLPVTCGRCHAPEASAFARSAHRERLEQGDTRAPSCISCHTEMASDVPSPAALQRECRRCHAEAVPDRAGMTKAQLDEIARLRTALQRAKLTIAIVGDPERRRALTAEWRDADRSVREVAAAMHAFDVRGAEAGLARARTRVEALFTATARRTSPSHEGG